VVPNEVVAYLDVLGIVVLNRIMSNLDGWWRGDDGARKLVGVC
jgi:hypothetical protein